MPPMSVPSPRLPTTVGPLYDKVKSYILGQIAAGAWPADARVPSEHELVEQLGVSRMTVHRALRELSSAGVLVRIQGVGTFVAPPQLQSPVMEVRDIATEIRARGRRHACTVVVLEETRLPDDLVTAFGFAEARPVYHSVMVHSENGAPVQVEERFVNPALAPDYLEQDFARCTAHEYLQARAPLTEVEHVITATGVEADFAPLLGLEPGDPVLLLRRRTWSGSAVATVNRLIYPGDRYALGDRRVIGGG